MVAGKKHKKNNKAIIVPPTGVSQNKELTCIICHLHGIPEEEIRIDLEKTCLTISATHQNMIVMQKITVTDGSRIQKKKFLNGILEIILEQPE